MELLILISCLSVSQAFPSPKINPTKEGNNQISDIQISTSPNLKLTLENSNHQKKTFVARNKSSEIKQIIQAIEKINSLKAGQGRTFGTLASFAVGGLMAALDLVEEVIIEGNTGSIDEDIGNFVRLRRQKEMTTPIAMMETTTHYQIPTATSDLPTTETITTDPPTTTMAPTTTQTIIDFFDNEILASVTTQIYNKISLEIEKDAKDNSTNIRQPRQEEDEDDDEGGGGGLLGAIISGFLGSLSKPDGSVDVDAVVSVIGSLSAMRDDGTYDFSGLTDTLSAFFGGDDEGGSDVGSFAGGVLAAVITGIANPPGAKGAGNFAGNLLKQLLPALSGPGPTAEGVTTVKPQVNAGGFLWGLLNSLFGMPANGTNGSKPGSPFFTIKMNLIKYVLSALSSILTSSSNSKNGKDW